MTSRTTIAVVITSPLLAATASVDAGMFYRSSEIQLDGERAPLVTEVRLKNLPSGEYTVIAVLRDQMGRQTMIKQSLPVLSALGEP